MQIIEGNLTGDITWKEEEELAKERKQIFNKFQKYSAQVNDILQSSMQDEGLVQYRIESQKLLSQMSELMTDQTNNGKKFHFKKIKRDSKIKSLNENIKFLEGKVSAIMIEKEEQSIKLKSEFIIQKQKAKQYKEQLKEQIDNHEITCQEMLQERVKDTTEKFNQDIENLTNDNQKYLEQIKKMKNDTLEMKEGAAEFKAQISSVVKNKDEIIIKLEEKLGQIDQKYKKKIGKTETKKDETQKKLNIEEKEKEIYGLKFEQMMSNNKKLQLQKKFLERQLDKDVREMRSEMTKIQVEIQQDQMINSANALERFKSIFSAVSDQFVYIQQIVGFMDFDQEAQQSKQFDNATIEEVGKEIINNIHPEQQTDNDTKLDKTQSVENTISYPASPKGYQESESILINDESKSPMHLKKQTTSPNRPKFSTTGTNRNLFAGGSPKGVNNQLSIEDCWNLYPSEFKQTQQYEQLKQLINMTQSHIDRVVTTEINEKQLLQNQQQFQQQIYKLQEKCKSLEIEKKNLRLKQGSMEFTENQASINITEDYQQPGSARQKSDIIIREENFVQSNSVIVDQTEPFPQPIQSRSSTNQNTAAKSAVPPSSHQTSDVAKIDFLTEQNVALKERCKEIRLNLQRKITELQDKLIISRQKYMSELSELKLEYGKDLNRITKLSKERQSQLQSEFSILEEKKIEQLVHDFKHKEEDLHENIIQNAKKSDEAIEQADSRVRDAERDLKKLKKESTGFFKGGFGTFIIAFEGEAAPERNILQSQRKQSEYSQEQSLRKPIQKSSRVSNAGSKELSPRESTHSLENSYRRHEEIDTNQPHPIEKINHFVEVGFLMDRNDFKLINTFDEGTFDSNLKKYLFEFQDSIECNQMNALEFKVKQQLTDNHGLFNEIKPVYISLNMGRPSTAFSDDYIPQDQFRLVKREGVSLSGNRWMTVSFLKCDYLTQGAITQESGFGTPTTERKNIEYHLRVIAFENETSSQYTFDLNYSDLLILMHGNIKLLEDDSSHDLCQILINSLTMIQREKVDAKGKVVYEDILIAEHKIFFNEQYRAVYDKKNKNIMAHYDKKRQGLVQDAALETEFDKAIIYEAFQKVYEDEIQLMSAQPQIQNDNITVEVSRGTMSGNIKLSVMLHGEGLTKEMYLFNDEQCRSHKVCSEVLHVTQPDAIPLAYVISLEKMYGVEEVIVVRLTLIEKWDHNVMSEYTWNPEGRPQQGSTQFNSETLYLVKKSDNMYCRIAEYEILNTEVRTLLFMHSYGYSQANIDFGNIRRYLEQSDNARENYVSILGSDQHFRENLNINLQNTAVIDKFKGLNQLLYRQFYTVRVRKILTQQYESNPESEYQSDPQVEQSTLKLKVLKQEGTLQQQELSFTSHHGLISFFNDGQCLERGEILIKVVCNEENIDITYPVSIQSDINNMLDSPENIKTFCEKMMDRMVVEIIKNVSDTIEQSPQFQIVLDKDIEPMSQLLAQSKQLRFEEMLRHEEGRSDDSNILMEIKDVQELQVSLIELSECKKASQMTLVNQKLCKVTSYFVKTHAGFEPKLPQEKRIFEWAFMYIEVAHRSADQKIVLGITEKDLLNIMEKLRLSARVTGASEQNDLIYNGISREALLNIVLDCLLIDPVSLEAGLSMVVLQTRLYERSKLEEMFTKTGGSYVKMIKGHNPDLCDFEPTTNVFQTELTQKLITNITKDMSDKVFDVKIYEFELKSLPGAKKFRLEIYWLDKPDYVFRCDMFSNPIQDGSHILIERINIVEYSHKMNLQDKGQSLNYDPNQFVRDALVLTICESNFPHEISFMLLEPCSRIQWDYSYSDAKLSIIETRQQRLNFISNLYNTLKQGILRNITDDKRAVKINHGSQSLIGEDQNKDIQFCIGDINQMLMSEAPGIKTKLMYTQLIQIAPDVFKRLTVDSNVQQDMLIVKFDNVEEGQQDTQTVFHIRLNSQNEGCRIVCGCFASGLHKGDTTINSHLKNLIYSVEIACATTSREKVIRFSVFDQSQEASLLSVVFIDSSLCERGRSELPIADTVKFAINSGFKDSLSIPQTMTCLNYDWQLFELNQQLKITETDNVAAGDLMRDFKSPALLEGMDSAVSKRTKNEEVAFETLANLKQQIIEKSHKSTTLLHRKALRLDRGRKTIMVSALRESNSMIDSNYAIDKNSIMNEKYIIKLILFENKRVDIKPIATQNMQINQITPQYDNRSNQPSVNIASIKQDQIQDNIIHNDYNNRSVQKAKEYVFVFKYSEVFTEQQLYSGELEDQHLLKKYMAEAMNKRLRIKEIIDQISSNQSINANNAPLAAACGLDYFAFFLEEKQLNTLPKNPAIQKLDLLETNKKKTEFDMRQLHSYSLLNPECKIGQQNESATEQLIYTFQKDDLLYEVYELNALKELFFRLKVYDYDSFRMLTSSEIGESELKVELVKDRRSYLTGPKKREELSKYIINNTFFNEGDNTLRFMRSNLVEDI